MENIKIAIKPVSYSVSELVINNISVVLNSTATIGGFIYGEKIGLPFNVELSKAEYEAWGNDDNYITNIVLSKLGLEKA